MYTKIMRFEVTVGILFILPTVFSQAVVDPKCVIDDTLAAVGANVMDCNTAKMIEEKRTDCCKIDGTAGCCDPNAKWNELKLILIGIGCGTVALMIMVFVCMWCNKKTFPFLERWETQMEEGCYRCQKKLPCCREQAEAKKKYEEEMKKQEDKPDIDMPPELMVEAKDDFFDRDPNIQGRPIEAVSMTDMRYIE